MHRPTSTPSPPSYPPSSPKIKASFSRRRSFNHSSSSGPSINLSRFDSYSLPKAIKSRSFKSLAIYTNLLVFFLIAFFYYNVVHEGGRTGREMGRLEVEKGIRESRLDLLRSRTLASDAEEIETTQSGEGMLLLGGYLRRLESELKSKGVLGEGEGQLKGSVYGGRLTEFQEKRYKHLKDGSRKWLLTSVLLNVAHITPGEYSRAVEVETKRSERVSRN